MRVDTGIVVSVYNRGSGGNSSLGGPAAKIRLNRPAVSVKGSMISDAEFTINMEWKNERFESHVGQTMALNYIMVKMTFTRGRKEFWLSGLVVSQAAVDGSNLVDSNLRVRDIFGGN